MSSSRFEYSEICPTCKDAGVTGDDEKPITLGFDLDTHEISCGRGHVYESLPSEAASVAKTIPSNETYSATQTSETLQPDATKELVFGSENEPVEAPSDDPSCHTLEAVSETDAQNSAQEDSAALAQLSARIAAEINVQAELMSVPARAAADAETQKIAARVETRDVIVADGVRLSNGDLAVSIVVSEQWAEAVKAESEIQGLSVSDYLTREVGDYLANYWTSNYTQAR